MMNRAIIFGVSILSTMLLVSEAGAGGFLSRLCGGRHCAPRTVSCRPAPPCYGVPQKVCDHPVRADIDCGKIYGECEKYCARLPGQDAKRACRAGCRAFKDACEKGYYGSDCCTPYESCMSYCAETYSDPTERAYCEGSCAYNHQMCVYSGGTGCP